MKYETTCNCMYKGRILRKGAVIELPYGDESAKRSCFRAFKADGQTQPKEEQDNQVRRDKNGNEAISKNGLRQKLEELRVPYRASDTYEKLMERYKDATARD